jgi:hypothetical protein
MSPFSEISNGFNNDVQYSFLRKKLLESMTFLLKMSSLKKRMNKLFMRSCVPDIRPSKVNDTIFILWSFKVCWFINITYMYLLFVKSKHLFDIYKEIVKQFSIFSIIKLEPSISLTNFTLRYGTMRILAVHILVSEVFRRNFNGFFHLHYIRACWSFT